MIQLSYSITQIKNNRVTYMVIDITGIILTPGNEGKNCSGNGEHMDNNRNLIECCCDECDYYLECFPNSFPYK